MLQRWRADRKARRHQLLEETQPAGRRREGYNAGDGRRIRYFNDGREMAAKEEIHPHWAEGEDGLVQVLVARGMDIDEVAQLRDEDTGVIVESRLAAVRPGMLPFFRQNHRQRRADRAAREHREDEEVEVDDDDEDEDEEPSAKVDERPVDVEEGIVERSTSSSPPLRRSASCPGGASQGWSAAGRGRRPSDVRTRASRLARRRASTGGFGGAGGSGLVRARTTLVLPAAASAAAAAKGGALPPPPPPPEPGAPPSDDPTWFFSTATIAGVEADPSSAERTGRRKKQRRNRKARAKAKRGRSSRRSKHRAKTIASTSSTGSSTRRTSRKRAGKRRRKGRKTAPGPRASSSRASARPSRRKSIKRLKRMIAAAEARLAATDPSDKPCTTIFEEAE